MRTVTAVLVLLSACPMPEPLEPPKSLRECREQAYERFDNCVRGISMNISCENELRHSIRTCVEAFPDELQGKP